MISLSSQITINPPVINGRTIKPTTLTSIDYGVVYDNARQEAVALLKGINMSLILWNQHTTPPYSAVGQFSDADTDARVSELLNVAGGNDAITSALVALYPSPKPSTTA